MALDDDAVDVFYHVLQQAGSLPGGEIRGAQGLISEQIIRTNVTQMNPS